MDTVVPQEQDENLTKENEDLQDEEVKNETLITSGNDTEAPNSNVEVVTIKSEAQVVQSPKNLLDKEQIKKRLQSFSLLKQGLQVSPIKKILNKSTQNKKSSFISGEHIYDENGEKTSEKIVIKKPERKKGNSFKIFLQYDNHLDVYLPSFLIHQSKDISSCFY